MLKGETIIYFGPEPWDGMWRNRHQLMSRLAAANTVVYVEPPATLRSLLRNSTGTSSAESIVTEHESGVIVYRSPAWTPLVGRGSLRNLSIRFFIRMLKAKCAIPSSCQPMIWLSRPQMSDYIGNVNEKLAIYHVVDEYMAYVGIDAETRAWLLAHEQAALRKANAVVVVTPTLFDSKSPYNPNTYLVPNAVNYDAYANPITEPPADLANIESPIIGFTGLVSARLDFALLSACAHERPDWSFVFIGSINDSECETALIDLNRLDNVHFLGVKPVEAMPAYLQHFDVCTIPYAADDSAANASPLKLYEYAAVRRPIVTTDFPAAREFPGHLQRVTTADEFLRACEQALTLSRDDPTLAANQQFAAANTWEHRVEAVTSIMQDHVAKRNEC